jgi:hypothetical protein
MPAMHALIRRLRALWTALVGALRGTSSGPRAALDVAQPVPVELGPAPELAAPPTLAVQAAIAEPGPEPERAALIVAPEVFAELAGAALSMPGAAVSMPGAAMIAEVAQPELPAGPREVLRAGAPAEDVTVRQFFARVATAAPGGLQVDFAAWQVAKVERYFLAMSTSERGQQRGAALAEDVGLSRAFDGFQWD